MSETLYRTNLEGYMAYSEWMNNFRHWTWVWKHDFRASWCWRLKDHHRSIKFPQRYHLNTIDLTVRVPDDRLVEWISLVHDDFMPEKWSVWDVWWEYWLSKRELSWTYWHYNSYRFFYLPNYFSGRFYNGIESPWLAILQTGSPKDTPPITHEEIYLHEYLEHTDDKRYLKNAPYFRNPYYMTDRISLRID